MNNLTPYARSLEQQRFVRRYQGAARHFAARLLNETRLHRSLPASYSEKTEAFLACEAERVGCTAREREQVIGGALDAGLVRATIIQWHELGLNQRRFAPALVGCL